MSKKALITGITGQDGSYLAEFLLDKGYEVHGIVRRSSLANTGRIDHLLEKNAVKLHDGDLSDSSSIIRIVGEVQPDEIYNGEIGTLHGVRFVETSEAKIWKGTGCPAGLAVFSTLILGAHAYGSTEIEGGGLEHIVKQLGYGDDPLNQRASVGWKAHKTAERLVEQYMVRIESCSARYSATAEAN